MQTSASRELHGTNTNGHYQQRTERNYPIIDTKTQNLLRHGKFLVAGCGSIGGAIVEPLVRIGAEHLVIAEPDSFELGNLNRQPMQLHDVGINKGVAVATQMMTIAPSARIEVVTDGVQPTNVQRILNDVDVVFDGVDVTNSRAIACKLMMHCTAKAKRIPVISGYDIGALQLLIVYRYDQPAVKVFHGIFSNAELQNAESLNPMSFLLRTLPSRYITKEVIPAAYAVAAGELSGFPQVVFAARAYGNMALAAAIEILNGRPTRRYVAFDHVQAVRPWRGRIRTAAQQWWAVQCLRHKFKTA